MQDVDQVFRYWKALGDSIQPGQCMQELLERVRRHKVNIDGDVCTVMVTTLVLEGWQRKLDPELNFVQTLNNLLFKADWQRSLSYMINGLMAP
jgi:aarF domain-containing kinase